MMPINSSIVVAIILTVAGGALFLNSRFASQTQSKPKLHPAAKIALNTLSEINTASAWDVAKPLVEELKTERRLSKLMFGRETEQNSVFALFFDGRVFDAQLENGLLKKTINTHPSAFSEDDFEYITNWINTCEKYNALGFDVRNLPEYCIVFFMMDPQFSVQFIVTGEQTSARYKENFYELSKKGVDSRGDAYLKLTNDVYISTERR